MSPGAAIRIEARWGHSYPKPGAASVGIVEALSPSGRLARVRFDEAAAFFVLVAHLEPVVEPRRAGSPGSRRRGGAELGAVALA